MPVTIDYSDRARIDIRDIVYFYQQNSDDQSVARIILRITADIRYLSENPMLGRRVQGLGRQYRYWYALNKKYKVYFTRPTPELFVVLRIYSSKLPPLKPQEIVG